MQAATTVIRKHPVQFSAMIFESFWNMLNPTLREQPVSIKNRAEFAMHLEKFHALGLRDTERLKWPDENVPQIRTFFDRPFSLWLYLKPVAALVTVVGLVVAIASPRKRIHLLTVTVTSASYSALLAVSLEVPLERYYQPLEYLTVLTVALLFTAFGTVQKRDGYPAPGTRPAQ